MLQTAPTYVESSHATLYEQTTTTASTVYTLPSQKDGGRCPANTPPEPHANGSRGQQRSAEQCRSLGQQNETDRCGSGEFPFADRLAAELKNVTDLLKPSFVVAVEEEVVCVDSLAGRRNSDVQDGKASVSNTGDLSSSFAALEASPVHAPSHHHRQHKSCYPHREEQEHQPKHPKEAGAFYHHENERRLYRKTQIPLNDCLRL